MANVAATSHKVPAPVRSRLAALRRRILGWLLLDSGAFAITGTQGGSKSNDANAYEILAKDTNTGEAQFLVQNRRLT